MRLGTLQPATVSSFLSSPPTWRMVPGSSIFSSSFCSAAMFSLLTFYRSCLSLPFRRYLAVAVRRKKKEETRKKDSEREEEWDNASLFPRGSNSCGWGSGLAGRKYIARGYISYLHARDVSYVPSYPLPWAWCFSFLYLLSMYISFYILINALKC